MNTIDNINETTRRGLCFAMALAIVVFGLTTGAVGADAAWQDAVAQSHSHVSVVQLASL